MGIDTLEKLPPEAKAEAQKMEEKKEESEIKIDHELIKNIFEDAKKYFESLKKEGEYVVTSEHGLMSIRTPNHEISYSEESLKNSEWNTDIRKWLTIKEYHKKDQYGQGVAEESEITAFTNENDPKNNRYEVLVPPNTPENEYKQGKGETFLLSENNNDYNVKKSVGSLSTRHLSLEISDNYYLKTPQEIQHNIFEDFNKRLQDKFGAINNERKESKDETIKWAQEGWKRNLNERLKAREKGLPIPDSEINEILDRIEKLNKEENEQGKIKKKS